MNTIFESVTRIAGHRGNCYYATLIRAIEVAAEGMPRELSMKEICARVSRITGKTLAAVSQDLSRSVLDIWENGDRRELIRLLDRDPKVKPSPKDFVIELGQRFWSQQRR